MSRRRKQQRADEQPGTRPAVSSHVAEMTAAAAPAIVAELYEPDGRDEPHPLAERDIEDVVDDPAATLDDVEAWYRARRDPDLQQVIDSAQQGLPAILVPTVGGPGVFLPESWDERPAFVDLSPPDAEPIGEPGWDMPSPVPSDTRFTAIFGACADVAGKRGLGAAAARLHEAQLALDEFRAKLPAAIAAMRALGMPGEFVADLERMAAVL